MVGERYLLTRPLLAVQPRDGLRGDFATIPENSVVAVEGFHGVNHIVIAKWEKKTILVFAQDLVERGVLVTCPRCRKKPLNVIDADICMQCIINEAEVCANSTEAQPARDLPALCSSISSG